MLHHSAAFYSASSLCEEVKLDTKVFSARLSPGGKYDISFCIQWFQMSRIRSSFQIRLTRIFSLARAANSPRAA